MNYNMKQKVKGVIRRYKERHHEKQLMRFREDDICDLIDDLLEFSDKKERDRYFADKVTTNPTSYGHESVYPLRTHRTLWLCTSTHPLDRSEHEMEIKHLYEDIFAMLDGDIK